MNNQMNGQMNGQQSDMNTMASGMTTGMTSEMTGQDSKTKKGLGDKLGELVEKVGHKISDAGATKVGQAIHDLGDRLEKTHRDPNHPEKV